MFVLFGLLSAALGSSVFIIDDGDESLVDLVSALESKGHDVETSVLYGFTEIDFMGFELDLDAFDVVIWLDGVESAPVSMPELGQERLLDFVADGGGIVLFGQNGFNRMAGRHPLLAPLIPMRSWILTEAGSFDCVDDDHPLCDGFDPGSAYGVPGGRLSVEELAHGELIWETAWSGEEPAGAVYEYGEGRGAQWALWGNSYSDYWQTQWLDTVTAQLLDNSVRWVGQGPPRPDAGGPYAVVAGDTVVLDGSGSEARGEADIVLYEWDVDGYMWATTEPLASFDTIDVDGPALLSVTLTVHDSEGRTRSADGLIVVDNADPIIGEVSCPDSLLEGELGTFSADAADPEAVDTLTFSWVSDGDEIAVGEVAELGFAQNGTYSVSIVVEDDDGGTASQGCIDDVLVDNVPPEIVGEPILLVDAGTDYVFAPEVDDPGIDDIHAWVLDGPSGMTVEPSSGLVMWSPTLSDIGSHSVRLTVTDGDDDSSLEWDIEVQWPDADIDGVRADTDCDDLDESIYPGAPEVCDAVDSDCDGSLVDDFEDLDGDGVPNCIDPDADGDGYDASADCDDLSGDSYPGASESCDSVDSDCDGSLIDGFSDSDEDGLPDCVDDDTDGDGMADAWEEEFGLDPEDASDGTSDDDGDGRTAAEEYASGSDPTLYEGPGAPEALVPEDGGEINETPGVLVVSDGAAPLGQDLVHSMTLAMDPTLETVIAMATELEGAGDGTTGWMIDIELMENTWYYWTASASDDWTTGASMAPARFFFNLINEEPAAPGINSPLDGSAAAEVILVADVPLDPDLDAVDLVFTVELEDGARVESPLLAGAEAVVSWEPAVVVDEDAVLCWWVSAVDEHGLEGPVSETACFTVDRTNLPPEAPSFTAPDGDIVDTLQPTLVVANGVDPEGVATQHRFQVDVDETFGSVALQEALISSGADGQTEWTVDVAFEEDTRVWARAQCSDGEQDSEWVTTSFLVSTTNDPPGVPVLMDPADGVAFGEGLELVVSNSVDPEGETVSHDFHILDLRDALVEGVEGVEQGDSVTAWAPELLDEGHYQWTSRAMDASGVSSDWAEPRTIVVGNPDHAVEPDLGGMVDDKQAEGCSCSSTSSQRSSLIWLTLAIFGLAQRRKTPRC